MRHELRRRLILRGRGWGRFHDWEDCRLGIWGEMVVVIIWSAFSILQAWSSGFMKEGDEVVNY